MRFRPRNVLFLCTGNSARSIIAEALLRRLGGARFRAFSAGSDPKGEVHPLVLDELTRRGHDVSGLRSKSTERFMMRGAPLMDFVVTVCGNAANSCPTWPGQPELSKWLLPDPVEGERSEAEMRMAIGDVYGELEKRLRLFTNLPEDCLSALALEEMTSNAAE